MTRFRKGVSGNPNGRPKRPGLERLREQIAEAVPDIVAVLVESAKAGDIQASRLLLDRVLPTLRPVAAPVPVPLGSDLAQASGAVLVALQDGTIGTDQASDLAGVLSALARVQETLELAARVAALEERTNGNP